MNRKAYQGAFSARLVVVLVSFLSVVVFAGPNISLAATGKKKASVVAKTSEVDRAEARIKQLQGALKITDAQEEQWRNVTQVMRDNAKEMDTLTEGSYEKSKTMNAVEHLKFHSMITEARVNQMKKFIPPFEALYGSMSDDQKKTTDTIFRTGKYGKHRFQ